MKVLLTFAIAVDVDSEDELADLNRHFDVGFKDQLLPLVENYGAERIDELFDFYGPTITVKREAAYEF